MRALRNFGLVIRAGALAAILLAPVEALVTVILAEGEVGVLDWLKLTVVAATLLPLVAALCAVAPGIALAAARRPLADATRRLLVGRSPEPPREDDPRRAGAVWGGWIAAAVFVAALSGASFVVAPRFRDPIFAALATGVSGLGCAALALLVWLGARAVLGALGRKNWPLVSRPFSRPRAAWSGSLAFALAAGVAVLAVVPSLRELVPIRLAVSILVLAASACAVLAWLGERRLGSRGLRAGVIAAWTGLLALSLTHLGADPQVKYLMTIGSPALERSGLLVRALTDVDGDGYGVLLGEGDCDPWDPKIHPGALEIPDNGRDEDCVGGDFSYRRIRKSAGKARPVPEAFRQKYNFLMVTIDALRVDHTGFGGYERPTTPHLDELARGSVVFERSYAPSAGTVASVPAILASRFFHSQLAVGPERKRKPPLILPENLLIAEIMKKGGYRTGAILSHDYFNDWGLEQGFDHYDNSLGPKREPHAVTGHKVTDKATAFIAASDERPWFLWVHYVDAHSEYEPHPEFDFGPRPIDLYDGEIRFVDEHFGRLLAFLRRTDWSRTVIAVTADHGDGFGEHGRTHHGSTLFDEMIRVPLLVRVPHLPGAKSEHITTPLDVVPTIVELAGLSSPAHDFEGRSLVPQLFYGEVDKDRAVFAETNWPTPLRAMIFRDKKLIYDLKRNLYHLYDLKKDPGEKRNLATRPTLELSRLQSRLWDWLSRAVFQRTKANQAEMVRAENILERLPPTAKRASATFDGAVSLEGFEAPAVDAKSILSVTAYLRAPKGTARRYRFHARATVARDGRRGSTSAKDVRSPLEGFYPTLVWKPDELIRQRFDIRIPKSWKGSVDVQLGVEDDLGKLVPAEGEDVDGSWASLDTIELK